MTLAYQKYIFRDGDQIDPDTVNRAEESVNTDWWKTLDRRYFHSMFHLSFDGIADTNDDDIRGYEKIDVDLEFKVRKIELFAVGGASVTHTLTVSGTAISTQTFDLVNRGSGKLGYKTFDVNIDSALGEALNFHWSASGAVTTTRLWAVIHIVSDRQTGNSQTETGSAAFASQELKSGDTMTAASFNGVQTQVNNQEQQERNREYACAISVLNSFTDSAVGWADDTWGYTPVPAAKMTFAKAKAYLVAPSGRDMQVDIDNETPTQQATATVVGVASTFTASANITLDASVGQSTHDPEDSADSWAIDSDQTGAGTVEKHFVVVAFI